LGCKGPWQQLLDPIDWMVRNALEDVSYIAFGIEAVELCSADQRVYRRGALAPIVGSGEQPVFASEGDTAQRPLGSVVIGLESPVLAEPRECDPVR
jgi:hypothetical protein